VTLRLFRFLRTVLFLLYILGICKVGLRGTRRTRIVCSTTVSSLWFGMFEQGRLWLLFFQVLLMSCLLLPRRLWLVFLVVCVRGLALLVFFLRRGLCACRVRSSRFRIRQRLGLCSRRGRLCLCQVRVCLRLVGMGMKGSRSVLRFSSILLGGLGGNLGLGVSSNRRFWRRFRLSGVLFLWLSDSQCLF